MKKNAKKIVVIYSDEDWDKEVPMDYKLTRYAFEKWQKWSLEKGIEMFRASIEWYDEKSNTFSKAWAYRDGVWKRVIEKIVPDLVYDKTAGVDEYKLFSIKLAMSLKTKVFNNPLFRSMVDNKLSQYVIFSEFMPKSFVATNDEELGEAIAKIASEKIVIKPLQGSGGVGIVIDEANELLKRNFQYPVIVQEFIRNDDGIPGFSKKGELADLRIVFMNHEPIYAISRIAKRGSLFTNQHQGAKSVRVPLKSVPKSVWDMTEEIKEKLSIFSKAQYSLDFFFSGSKPYFIEMNTVPGLCIVEELNDESLQKKDFEAFISLLN